MLGLFQPRCSKLFTVCPEFLVDLMKEFTDQRDNAWRDCVSTVGEAVNVLGDRSYA